LVDSGLDGGPKFVVGLPMAAKTKNDRTIGEKAAHGEIVERGQQFSAGQVA
jgi:hypothetical protein